MHSKDFEALPAIVGSVEALSAIMRSVVGSILSFLGKVVGLLLIIHGP